MCEDTERDEKNKKKGGNWAQVAPDIVLTCKPSLFVGNALKWNTGEGTCNTERASARPLPQPQLREVQRWSQLSTHIVKGVLR